MSFGMPFALPEVRSTGAYTRLQLNAAYDSAIGGTDDALARRVAVIETAAGLWARAFGAARPVGGTDAARAVLTPPVMAQIGRDLVLRGESLWRISVMGGALDLLPAGTWSVLYGVDRESDWRYWLVGDGPGGTKTYFEPSAAVLHARWAVHTSRRWQGIAPMLLASNTASLSGSLESRLAQEASAPVGSFIPVPADGGDGEDEDPLAPLKRDIAAAKGRQVLVETTSAGFGDKAAAPQSDWVAKRFGAHPPAVLDALRSNSERSLCSACGVPVSLITNADGTSQRESWRRFGMGSVGPMLRIVGDEMRRKLDSPDLSFDIRSLWSHDAVGRAQTFKALIASGMAMPEAAAASGILMEDM